MALRPDLLGASTDPVEFSWGPDEVMLYALAVGAGQDEPTGDLSLTTENAEGAPLRTLPGFANIITRGLRVHPPIGEEDPRVLHAEQAFRVRAPLPTAGRARVTGRVVALDEKRGGLLVHTLAEAVDTATGTVLAETVQTIMIRGEADPTPSERPGQRAAEPLLTPPGPIPDRAPDRTVAMPVPADQALLYRLTGDRNPLHTDPAFARRAGFDRPILHGMCTYGFTARVLADDPAALVGMQARFTRPVWPGDRLEVSVWQAGGGVHFRTTRDGEPVLDRGWAEFREAHSV